MKLYRYYNDEFNKTWKVVEIICFINVILCLLTLVLFVLHLGLAKFLTNPHFLAMFVFILYQLGWSWQFLYKDKNTRTQEGKFKNDKTKLIVMLCLSPVVWLNIPMLIASINLAKCLAIVVEDYKNNPVPAVKKGQEIDESKFLLEERQHECENVLSVIGIIFFIENYEILKNYPLIDAVDAIKTFLPYNEKKRRTAIAKKLFAQNLDKIALEYILQSESNLIDSEMKKRIVFLIQNG